VVPGCDEKRQLVALLGQSEARVRNIEKELKEVSLGNCITFVATNDTPKIKRIFLNTILSSFAPKNKFKNNEAHGL
jgi:hypothetical protein